MPTTEDYDIYYSSYRYLRNDTIDLCDVTNVIGTWYIMVINTYSSYPQSFSIRAITTGVTSGCQSSCTCPPVYFTEAPASLTEPSPLITETNHFSRCFYRGTY